MFSAVRHNEGMVRKPKPTFEIGDEVIIRARISHIYEHERLGTVIVADLRKAMVDTKIQITAEDLADAQEPE